MISKVRIKIMGIASYSIKMLLRKKIDIFNIEYHEDYTVFTISHDDLEKLENESIEILNFGGIKNLLIELKRHRHFICSVILSIVIMVFLSNVVFNVTVVHSNRDIRELIEDELYDAGVKPFTLKKSFKEIQEIKNRIRDEHPNEIEWLEINDDGMRYTVRVEERIITEPETHKDYCNIISTKDATILNIISKKGQTIVNSQEFVKKGSVLISGEVKFNDEVKSHVCADGVVYGNTWYKVAISVPYEHVEKEYTKNKSNNLAFEVGSKYARIFKVHFDKYDVEKIQLFKFGKFAIYKEVIHEYRTISKTYSYDEALKEALKEAREHLKINIGDNAEILSEKVLQSEEYNSIISLEIFYSVKEVISKVEEKEYISEEELE